MELLLTGDNIIDIDSDLLLLNCLEDERPLKGSLGLVDWYECGIFSRFILQEKFIGNRGEKLLYATSPALIIPRILLIGLGKKKDFSYFKVNKIYSEIGEVLLKLNINRIVLTLPSPAIRDFRTHTFVESIMSGILEGGGRKNQSIFSEHVFIFPDDKDRSDEILLGLQKLKVDYKGKIDIDIERKTRMT